MLHSHSSPLDCRCPHGGFSPRLYAQAKIALSRRSFIAGAAAAGVAALLPWRARAASMDNVTVLKAARLFDGKKMHAPGVLVIQGSRIVSFNAGDAGSSAHVIDLGDATLMPGLIDCHTHVAGFAVPSHYLAMPGRTSDNPEELAIYGLKNAHAMLANGFTTVRDVGGGWGVDLAVRDAINEGTVFGPSIFAAGPALSITGGHGDTNDIPDWITEDATIESGVAYGPYGFRQKVREHVKRHVDLVKILATGGVLSYGDTWDVPQLNLDEIQAVVDESEKFGRKVAAHCHGDKGISMAVEGGVHSVEHCTGVSDATLKKMEQRGTHLVPTIWALDSILVPGNPNHIPPGSVEKAEYAAKVRNEGMQRALASSVTITYGTDAGVFPHHENNKDFALLAKMGMHPLDLMKSTTSTAAALIGVNDRGSLFSGKRADIVAFKGDPSKNIALLESKPALVMVNGKRVNGNLLV
ncbi:MAG TPA: amidohydrolase family protein [Candidatus Aquilonibacter sp.]|nr:amidohydrolase family protein [Candidatus Aquilonibacter sp.]